MSSIDINWRTPSSGSTLLTGLAAYAFWKVVMWLHLARTRKQLANLSDEALADIGLTRDMALQEAARPFWDADTMPRKRIR